MVRSNIPSSMTVRDDTTLSGVTPGTVSASKAVVVDSSNDIVSGLNDLTVDGDLTVDVNSVLTGTVLVTGALTATAGVVDLTSSKYTAVARTAGDGTGTALIADAGSYQAIAVTSASANNWLVLPTPTPGVVLDLYVGANGYEIRSSAPSTVLIGAGTGGAAVESAIPANSVCHLVCIGALAWVGWTVTAATLAAVEAAAT